MLVDEITINVKAGKGGNGKVSFHQEKHVLKGGPDGGNGGNGGNVYLRAISDLGALNKYRFEKYFLAKNGVNGGSAKKTGANAEDLYLPVPVGTTVGIRGLDSGVREIGELTEDGQSLLVAKGGKGGRGNWVFRSPSNTTPKEAEPGKPGEEFDLYLELKLIADIGFIGLPNVGKSSLLNALTNTVVKIGDYPFTTLEPNLGSMDGLILADLPGLIEGASSGKGLGIKFLKHISRTKVLVHCIGADSTNPEQDYLIVKKELGDYSSELLNKKELVVITKNDFSDKADIVRTITKMKKVNINTTSCSIYDDVSLESLRKLIVELVNKN